ncbi:MAG: hypothetical protein HRU26_00035 [Psychroserpens sp.]|nr:hypothetical protein [Psychroserpens sp.]
MNSKLYKIVILTLLFVGFSNLSSAQELNFTNLQNTSLLSSEQATIDLKTYEVNAEDYTLDYSIENAPKSITESETQEQVLSYAMTMLAMTAGFGVLNSSLGSGNQTLWCLGAEYFYRIALINKAAFYGALGANYEGSSSDFVDFSLFQFSLNLLMFQQLVKRFQQVRWMYGIATFYGFGKEKFENGFDYDVTRLTIGLVLGLQIMLSQQWALMIRTNLFNYQEQKREYEDFEATDYNRWALINKSNILAFSLIYTFGNRLK